MSYTTETQRIIVLAGGGNRAYQQTIWLKKFCSLLGCETKDLWKQVAVAAGSSGGSMNASAIAAGLDISLVQGLYEQNAKKIFTIRSAGEKAIASHNTSTESNRPNAAQKAALIIGNEAFYESPYTDSNFGHNVLHSTLNNIFGSLKMTDLKIPVLFPVIDRTHKKYAVISNYNYLDYYIGQSYLVSDVLKATTAALPYLPVANINGTLYWDGGLYDNAPVQKAIDLAKIIKPTAKRLCILFLTTGQGSYGFTGSDTADQTSHMIYEIMTELDMAMYGSKESTVFSLDMLGKYQLNDAYRDIVSTYIYAPKLDTQNFSTEMDNSDPEFFDYMKQIVENDFLNNLTDISTFIGKWQS